MLRRRWEARAGRRHGPRLGVNLRLGSRLGSGLALPYDMAAGSGLALTNDMAARFQSMFSRFSTTYRGDTAAQRDARWRRPWRRRWRRWRRWRRRWTWWRRWCRQTGRDGTVAAAASRLVHAMCIARPAAEPQPPWPGPAAQAAATRPGRLTRGLCPTQAVTASCPRLQLGLGQSAAPAELAGRPCLSWWHGHEVSARARTFCTIRSQPVVLMSE